MADPFLADAILVGGRNLTNGDPVVFYVDSAQPDDSGNGLSWATAKKTVTAVLELVSIIPAAAVTINFRGTFSEQATVRGLGTIRGTGAGTRSIRFVADGIVAWDNGGVASADVPALSLMRGSYVSLSGVWSFGGDTGIWVHGAVLDLESGVTLSTTGLASGALLRVSGGIVSAQAGFSFGASAVTSASSAALLLEDGAHFEYSGSSPCEWAFSNNENDVVIRSFSTLTDLSVARGETPHVGTSYISIGSAKSIGVYGASDLDMACPITIDSTGVSVSVNSAKIRLAGDIAITNGGYGLYSWMSVVVLGVDHYATTILGTCAATFFHMIHTEFSCVNFGAGSTVTAPDGSSFPLGSFGYSSWTSDAALDLSFVSIDHVANGVLEFSASRADLKAVAINYGDAIGLYLTDRSYVADLVEFTFTGDGQAVYWQNESNVRGM